VARSVELKIKTCKGDLHFVNNLVVLHRRDEFVDDDEGSSQGEGSTKVGCEGEGEEKSDNKVEGKKKRHLVRMRIRNPEMAWDLPQELSGEWEKVFAEEGERVWHLEPMPEGFFPLRKYPL
jgi:hypothetical protein